MNKDIEIMRLRGENEELRYMLKEATKIRLPSITDGGYRGQLTEAEFDALYGVGRVQ